MTPHHVLAGLLASASFLAPLPAAVQLPVEVATWTELPAMATVSVKVPAGPASTNLFLQIHNLRFGGQVSVRVNGGAWAHLYNHTVAVREPERSQGGIGGINSTLRLTVSLATGLVIAGQSNTVSFRLNGTDGVVSTIRVIDFDFLDGAGARLLAPGELTQENPSLWTPPLNNAGDIAAGSNLWATAVLYNDPIQKAPIKAKCASCHFRDGSDLKYFNFSNGSIISRARFHGLTQLQGEQIASYLRALNKPSPGRPWNPPFQPGPNLDPDPGDSPAVKQSKAESWMAGAGLGWVTPDEAASLTNLFPTGTSRAAIAKLIEHEGNFSLREVPIPFQFPDWNTWLPDFAPEDMWSTNYYPGYTGQPYQFYNTLRNTLAAQGATNLANAGDLSETLADFTRDLNNWYGDFRLTDHNLSNEFPVSLARNPWLTREEVIRSLVHWMGIKIMEFVREHTLENKSDALAPIQAAGSPKYQPELLAIPGDFRLSTVFSFAPHIISDNWDNFTNQPVAIGKMESDQWYHLALLLNSGSRKKANMNVPIDWDYQLLHLEDASARTARPYAAQHLITHIKMYQSRDNGIGVKISGFSQRTLAPWRLYSDQNRFHAMHQDAFEEIEPGLWRKLFEEFMYEWFDVMESMNLGDTNFFPRTGDRHELNPTNYVPVAWPGGNNQYFKHPDEVYADLMYRLLPLLPKEDVDEMLLQDLIRWSKRAWPLGNWDTLITNRSLYFENFEDGASDFDVVNSVLTVAAIKDTNTWVNNYALGVKNGGGAYVGQRALTANALRSGINTNLNVPLNGATRLKLQSRVAFKAADTNNPGAVTFKMQLRFNGSAATTNAEDTITLDPGLFGGEFETYESFLNVPGGATNLTWLAVQWERLGGAGVGTVYLDNLHVLPVNTAPDVTPPTKPGINNVTAQNGERLRVLWPANPAAEGVMGYNVYRWRSSDSVSTKVKLNPGLVDNPYIWFEDYTVPRGVAHSYHVTAVDAAGNESIPSNTRSSTLPDAEAPLMPVPLVAFTGDGSVGLHWLGVTTWDIGGYQVFRAPGGTTNFALLAPGLEPTLSFTDTTASNGAAYAYRVKAVDTLTNLSAPTLTVTVTNLFSAPVEAWSASFNGVNGWDAANPSISGDAVDYDGDGIRNLWEYVLGSNPAVADAPANATQVALIKISGADFFEVSYLRYESLPPGVAIKVLFSDTLADWSVESFVEGTTVGAGIVVNADLPSGGFQRMRVRQSLPISAPGIHPFARLAVIRFNP